jgi:hypothetical protein
MAHGRPETPVSVHIVMTMAAGAHHSGRDVHIQIALFTIKTEGQTLPAMTGKACIHIPGFISFKNRFCALFCQMALVTAFHMATFAVKLVIRNFCNFHKSTFLLIPAAHAFSRKVKAICEKRCHAGLSQFAG